MKNSLSLLLLLTTLLACCHPKPGSTSGSGNTSVTETKTLKNPPADEPFTEPRIEPSVLKLTRKAQTIEVLVHDHKIKKYRVSTDHPLIKTGNIRKVENPHYLFVELEIPENCTPGKFLLELTNGHDVRSYTMELK